MAEKTITVPCLHCNQSGMHRRTMAPCEPCGGTGSLTINSKNRGTSFKTFWRLEYVGGGSSKFYELNREGLHVRMRWGRIGTTGQSDEKTFSTLSAAMSFAREKRDEKVRKGYREVQGGSALLDRQTGIPYGPAKLLIAARGKVDHVHACSECYEHKKCLEQGCTIEPDLTLDDGTPCGSHIFCDDCARQLASMRLDGATNDDDAFLRALGPALQEE